MKPLSRDVKLESHIDDYIRGKLNEDQVIDLWADLFDQPEYIGLLEIEIMLHAMLSRQGVEKFQNSRAPNIDTSQYGSMLIPKLFRNFVNNKLLSVWLRS